MKKIMKNELIGHLIDRIEDFLDEKNINIENPDKPGDPEDAVIYGEDYDIIAERLESTIVNHLKELAYHTETLGDNNNTVTFILLGHEVNANVILIDHSDNNIYCMKITESTTVSKKIYDDNESNILEMYYDSDINDNTTKLNYPTVKLTEVNAFFKIPTSKTTNKYRYIVMN